jgi:hypothetical protein
MAPFNSSCSRSTAPSTPSSADRARAIVGGVLPHRLAEFFGAGGDIAQIVRHLIGQAQVLAEGVPGAGFMPAAAAPASVAAANSAAVFSRW